MKGKKVRYIVQVKNYSKLRILMNIQFKVSYVKYCLLNYVLFQSIRGKFGSILWWILNCVWLEKIPNFLVFYAVNIDDYFTLKFYKSFFIIII